MLTIFRSLVCSVFTLLAFFAVGFSEIQAQTKEPAGTISGRVTVAGKGVAGITVAAQPSNTMPGDPGRSGGQPNRAVTDQDGRFKLTSLPAGQWRITPLAPALSNGAVTFRRPVILNEGETVDGVEVELSLGAVITGRVSDAAGRPLIAQRVNLIPADERGRGIPLFGFSAYGMNETDDRGVYRIYGLAAGRYLVSIGDAAGAGVLRAGSRSYYQRTYYPGVTEASRATVIELSEGGEASGIDISVGAPLKTFSVLGRVIDSNSGKPVPNIALGLGTTTRDDRGRVTGSSFMQSNFLTNNRGEFRIDGLLPGQYTANAVSRDEADWYSDPSTLEITEADVNNVEIKLVRSGSISGVAIIEGAATPADQTRLAELSLVASRVSTDPGSPPLPPPMPSAFGSLRKIAPDGTFRISGLKPGTFRISINFLTVDKEIALVRVERGGVPHPQGIEVGPGEQVSGVRLIFVRGLGVIKGTIKVEGGSLSTDATMILQGHPTNGEDYFVRATIDARGRFVTNPVMPGEYELTLTVMDRSGQQRIAPVKQTVTVTSGGEADLTFTVQVPPRKESNQ